MLNHDDSFVARIRPSIPPGCGWWFGIDPTLVDGLPSLYEADVRDDAGVPASRSARRRCYAASAPSRSPSPSPSEMASASARTLAQPCPAAMINATGLRWRWPGVLLGDRFDIRKTEQALRELEPAFRARAG